MSTIIAPTPGVKRRPIHDYTFGGFYSRVCRLILEDLVNNFGVSLGLNTSPSRVKMWIGGVLAA